ncbi:hypothetical protein FNV43_RR14889 [Rhamnella rubrinervis]|uniref:Uncharacterized protein n=1 Tax=Rhamnella rubrinervis TaxID=2594499 RepID=A0A8K0H3U3_9ROSA|nr:hypothetical protein FNV43_RR14889 [Rhamnella rubrinervis]
MPMDLNSCEGLQIGPVCTNGSSLATSFRVKNEPCDDSNLDSNGSSNFSLSMLPVKSEPQVSNDVDGDELDHMCLGDRMKLLKSRDDDSEPNMHRGYECLEKFELDHMCLADRMKLLRTRDECWKKFEPCVIDSCSSLVPESPKAISINSSRKRKKTATDSVETALEEDAPGLLQELVGQGISVDEIKLYGEMESDEALDESISEDSFTELEAVISKLFTQRHSFLKFPPLQFSKGARANYSLACLFSLVEQTRYLQFKKWPVEWGWCRDLQSFIFIFERHNRLVLERPEYGYATYFFELVDSLPLDWQIKRLITAMKLTGCSRMSLIENKPLVIGEDLTEGEAQVLMAYGWVPNSGLGTMLKYCDRVVHDRKNEKEISEWRTKIGKLLTYGYNGGTQVLTDIPKKVMENRDAQGGTQIKLEF